jgi:L-rhamnose mutarotase
MQACGFLRAADFDEAADSTAGLRAGDCVAGWGEKREDDGPHNSGGRRVDRGVFALGDWMERICFVLQVKPDRLDEYKRRHREVWPDMLAALRATGWSNYSLFLRDDGMLVGYLETEDFAAARSGMAAREVNERWQREMADFFQQPVGVLPDRAMQPLEEVFHL